MFGQGISILNPDILGGRQFGAGCAPVRFYSDALSNERNEDGAKMFWLLNVGGVKQVKVYFYFCFPSLARFLSAGFYF